MMLGRGQRVCCHVISKSVDAHHGRNVQHCHIVQRVGCGVTQVVAEPLWAARCEERIQWGSRHMDDCCLLQARVCGLFLKASTLQTSSTSMDGWMKKKRGQTPPPVPSPRHAKPRKRRTIVITDTDEEWQPKVDPRPCRLTCDPPSADVAVSAPQAQPPSPPLFQPKPVVAKPPPRCPIQDYKPLTVRRMRSDEDWLMQDAKPAEE